MILRWALFCIICFGVACAPVNKPINTPSKMPSPTMLINNAQAFEIQHYGSPDGKWVLNQVFPQVIVMNIKTVQTFTPSDSWGLNKGEYAVFGNWSIDSTAFFLYVNDSQIGCSVKSLAIFRLNRQVFEQVNFELPAFPVSSNCTRRAIWSPDSQNIALIIDNNILIINRAGKIIQEFSLNLNKQDSSIQDFVWTKKFGLLYREILMWGELTFLHQIMLDNRTHQILYADSDEFFILGEMKDLLIFRPATKERPSEFLELDLKGRAFHKPIQSSQNKQYYCGGLTAPDAHVAIIAIGEFWECGLDVKAITYNLSTGEIKDQGHIFGLMRWDTDTSSFLTLRGSESSSLALDNIKP